MDYSVEYLHICLSVANTIQFQLTRYIETIVL